MNRKGGIFKMYKVSSEMSKFLNKEHSNHSELVKEM